MENEKMNEEMINELRKAAELLSMSEQDAIAKFEEICSKNKTNLKLQFSIIAGLFLLIQTMLKLIVTLVLRYKKLGIFLRQSKHINLLLRLVLIKLIYISIMVFFANIVED